MPLHTTSTPRRHCLSRATAATRRLHQGATHDEREAGSDALEAGSCSQGAMARPSGVASGFPFAATWRRSGRSRGAGGGARAQERKKGMLDFHDDARGNHTLINTRRAHARAPACCCHAETPTDRGATVPPAAHSGWQCVRARSAGGRLAPFGSLAPTPSAAPRAARSFAGALDTARRSRCAAVALAQGEDACVSKERALRGCACTCLARCAVRRPRGARGRRSPRRPPAQVARLRRLQSHWAPRAL